MNKLAKLKAMSGNERRLLLQAWLLLPVVKILLWLTGYRRTLAKLQRLFLLNSDNPNVGLVVTYEKQQHASALGRLVNMAANHSPFEITCLPRSLVLWGMLRRAGLAADLLIGVQKEADVFAAHAWVEYRGQAVNEDAMVVVDYSPFAESFGLPEEGIAP
ncbi:MAG: lasso peptide biosynthesis B2 protein [Blastocatellia bacterium]